LGIAGCGLGSNVAVLAARAGFEKFILIDGDVVEISNLNRQEYFSTNRNRNKAKELKKILLGINPRIKCKIISKYITEKETHAIASKADFVINTLDYGPPFLSLIEECIQRKKVSIAPLNIGFGIALFVFQDKRSKYFRKFFSNAIKNNDEFYQYLAGVYRKELSSGIKKKLKSIFHFIQTSGYSPQLGLASFINASLILTIIIRLMDNRKRRFTKPIFLDLERVIYST
jgi:molybdopterin/thiamine biosynthesis adenylyltransferase